MVTAANAVHTMSGGVAVARGDTLCAQLALPYFGLLSDAPARDVASNLAAVEACLVEQGVDLARPFLTLSIMTLTVSPFVKFTDRGLIDTERRALLPTIINEA
jgi:adenine deaminase